MPSPRTRYPFRIGVRFRAPCPRAAALRGRLRGRARCLNFLCRICFWKARPARLRANRFTFACASRRGMQSGRAFCSAYPKAGMQPPMRRAITNTVRTVCPRSAFAAQPRLKTAFPRRIRRIYACRFRRIPRKRRWMRTVHAVCLANTGFTRRSTAQIKPKGSLCAALWRIISG